MNDDKWKQEGVGRQLAVAHAIDDWNELGPSGSTRRRCCIRQCVDEADASEEVDLFALDVEEYVTVDDIGYGYPAEDELVGSRTANSKTYVTEEGKVAIVTTDPIHYLDDEGAWQSGRPQH